MATATSSPLAAIQALGQATWLDNMSRELLDTGELARMISELNLQGMTSNPTIFEKAISQGAEYDDQLRELVREGADAFGIYDALTISDIARALDLFLPMYKKTGGAHGHVSLEVSPLLAHNTDKTTSEAQRLWDALARPNAMIKIPGTPEGLPAIEESLANGVNINVTLLFSVDAYERVAQTYIRALERRAAAGQPLDHIASVASFFVSRIDAEVDKRIDALLAQTTEPARRKALESTKGKTAIANAKNAYAIFQKLFSSPQFEALKAKGARVQRLLWASVGVKDPSYPDTLYVDELIGPETVSTMPPETFEAVRDHGGVRETLTQNMSEASRLIAGLSDLGIDFNDVTAKLLQVGVQRFSADFQKLLDSVAAKRSRILAES